MESSGVLRKEEKRRTHWKEMSRILQELHATNYQKEFHLLKMSGGGKRII